MKLRFFGAKHDIGRAAAAMGASRMREAIRERGSASIVLAAGPSQSDMLAALASEPDVRWDKVTCFQAAEYIGLPVSHCTSLRRSLWQLFIRQLPVPLAAFHLLNTEVADPLAECRRVGSIIHYHKIDVAFIDIGEAAQLAFNQPPADYKTEHPYIVSTFDEAARQQHVKDGRFVGSADAPRQAISMSVRQILKSQSIVCCVTDADKATAMRAVVEGPVSRRVPASILQEHEDCTLLMDKAASSRLSLSLVHPRRDTHETSESP